MKKIIAIFIVLLFILSANILIAETNILYSKEDGIDESLNTINTSNLNGRRFKTKTDGNWRDKSTWQIWNPKINKWENAKTTPGSLPTDNVEIYHRVYRKRARSLKLGDIGLYKVKTQDNKLLEGRLVIEKPKIVIKCKNLNFYGGGYIIGERVIRPKTKPTEKNVDFLGCNIYIKATGAMSIINGTIYTKNMGDNWLNLKDAGNSGSIILIANEIHLKAKTRIWTGWGSNLHLPGKAGTAGSSGTIIIYSKDKKLDLDDTVFINSGDAGNANLTATASHKGGNSGDVLFKGKFKIKTIQLSVKNAKIYTGEKGIGRNGKQGIEGKVKFGGCYFGRGTNISGYDIVVTSVEMVTFENIDKEAFMADNDIIITTAPNGVINFTGFQPGLFILNASKNVYLNSDHIIIDPNVTIDEIVYPSPIIGNSSYAYDVVVATCSAIFGKPGEIVNFSIDLIGFNNGPDNYSIDIIDELGWNLNFNSQVFLDVMDNATFEVLVEIPNDAINWTINSIIVNASSITDSSWYDTNMITVIVNSSENNSPPFAPEIEGPNAGKIKEVYDYNFTASDPNGDNMTYYVEWGDGDINEGSIESGDKFTLTHSWNVTGDYTIKAKAKDVFGAESEWSTFDVSITKSKSYIVLIQLLLQKFFQRFLIFEKILNQII
jgi:hypothetical protein